MDFEEQDYTKSIDLSLWGKILKFAFKYKKYVVAFIFLNFAVSFLSVVFPQLTRYAINHFVEAREYDNITAFSILFISLVALSALSWGIFLWIGNRLEVNIVHDIREKGFRKLQNLSFSYFDKTPVGWIMARMSSDSQKIGDVVAWNLFDLIWSTSLIILTIGAMLLTNVKLTIITIAVMPVMFIASIYFQKRILKGHRKTKKINSNITAAYNEGITGAKTTKTIIREEKNFEEFQELTSSMRNS
ncbi:MAG: ABC transporter ATP-binding protein, partial [Clostridiales bacterium]|nr:ABC transporter ATP-binding protein [Clostridiales bacterium]